MVKAQSTGSGNSLPRGSWLLCHSTPKQESSHSSAFCESCPLECSTGGPTPWPRHWMAGVCSVFLGSLSRTNCPVTQPARAISLGGVAGSLVGLREEYCYLASASSVDGGCVGGWAFAVSLSKSGSATKRGLLFREEFSRQGLPKAAGMQRVCAVCPSNSPASQPHAHTGEQATWGQADDLSSCL